MAGQIGRGGSEALFKMRMIMRIENQICKEFGCRLTSADSSKALAVVHQSVHVHCISPSPCL